MYKLVKKNTAMVFSCLLKNIGVEEGPIEQTRARMHVDTILHTYILVPSSVKLKFSMNDTNK